MRSIVDFSMKSGLLMVAFAVGVLVVGITQLPTMPVDALPEFTPPFVEVQTEALGLSAQEVEQLITVPLEQDLLNGVPWLREIRSESLPGLSSVVMTFEPGTELIRARQVVGERLTQAFALPHVSRPPTMLQPTSAANRVMMVGLSARDLSLIDLSVLARWTIAPRLMGVPGVANVSIWGQRDRQLQVQVDPKRLAAKNVTLLQVLETTGNAMWVSSLSFVEASTPGTGGFIESANQRIGIRHVFPISSPDGLAQVPVEGTRGMRLGDVANVVEDHQPLIGDAVAQTAGLLLVVEKSPKANTLEVAEELDKAIAAMRPGLSGVAIDASVYRADTFVQTALSNVGRAVLVGGLLLFVVLTLLLFNWRAAVVAALAIAVSFTAGAVVLYVREASANTMVLAGFFAALGLVIDDAIVHVDTALRRDRNRDSESEKRSPLTIIAQSSLEVRRCAFYALLVTALVVVPVWLIGGRDGVFMQSVAASYALALFAATLVALFITPTLCLLLFEFTPRHVTESPMARWLARGYDRALGRALGAPRLGLLAVAMLAAMAVALIPFLHLSLTPSFKERALLVHVDGAPGTSRLEMDRIVSRMSDELRHVAGVQNVGAHVGRALLSDRISNVNAAEVWIDLDASVPYDVGLARVRGVSEGYPGLRNQITTSLQDRIASFGDEARPLTVRVFGEDIHILRQVARNVQDTLTGIDGLGGQRIDLPPFQPTLEVEVDLARAQRYGLKPGDVRRAAATVLSGIQAGSLFEEQKIFDVVVWGTPEARNSVTSIRELLLDTPAGGHVRLGDIANVRVVPGLSVIRHQDVRSYLDILLDVHGRPADAVASDAQHRLAEMHLPLEYHAEVLGGTAAQQSSSRNWVSVAVAVLLGVFLTLQAAFGSWRLAALGTLLLPSGLAGGLLVAATLGGGVLTIGGLAGLVAVFGIQARQLIALFRRYQQVERDDGRVIDAVGIRIGSCQLFPTTLTTALGTEVVMLTTIVAGEVPGLEVIRPLALVVTGALITAFVVQLFVAPAGYLLLSRSAARGRERALEVVSVPAIPAAPVVTLLSMVLILTTACAPASRDSVDAAKAQPSRLEPIAGTDLNRVVLTQEAADRLDLQTEPVRSEVVDGKPRSVIPYAAVIYDASGGAWAYTSPAPLTFVRHKLEVDAIVNDDAVLTEGPPDGVQVVTVGGAELYGAEFEFQEG